MAMSWRTGSLFAAGLLVGVAVGGWAVIQARNQAVWQDNALSRAMGNAPVQANASAPQAQAQPVPVAAAPAPVSPAAAAQQCDGTPIVARGAEDGKETLQSAPRTAGNSEVASLLLTGKEAAASGRMRDAEVAFLNACRNAEVVSGPGAPVTLADAMYQLGRHYANVAQAGGARRSEMLQRSQGLLQAALQTYQARYGASHEKTRFAQQVLGTAQRLASGASGVPPAPVAVAKPQPAPAPAVPPKQEVAKAPPVVSAPPPAAPRIEARPAPAAPEAPVAQAPARPAPPPETAVARPVQPDARSAPREAAESPASPVARARTQPSFDCSRARSAPEKIVCADEELARQDRELGRLHARAEASAPDRAAFRRQNDAEWRRREENCRDRECVQRWYAERRAQLEAAQPEAAPSQETTRRRARPAPAPTTEARSAEPAREPAPPRRATAPAREEPEAAEPAPEAPVRSVQRRPQPRSEEPRVEQSRSEEPPPQPPGTAMGAPTAEGSVGDPP